MRKQPKSAHPHKPKMVPLENTFEFRLLQALRGSEYLNIIASVEHCAASDTEGERLLTLDPKVIMDFLHGMATVL